MWEVLHFRWQSNPAPTATRHWANSSAQGRWQSPPLLNISLPAQLSPIYLDPRRKNCSVINFHRVGIMACGWSKAECLGDFGAGKSQNPAPTGSGVPPPPPRLSTSLSCVEQGEALINMLLKALKLLGLQHADTFMGSVVQPLSTQPFSIKALSLLTNNEA